ncbi:right-handed parallel beta-helix repeat-containing protein [Actinospica durhamensis]|uniref:Right-handed parallel beta-helix repeat-containing protein n=1 Tax=Actinospica durhamensis TaxID=1508375 RepID=A0A941ENE0_9ACTN|nr:right-handed parallel beta-helix repeat-containing protein [Actinospica durhamensis]MBR7832224.1 right-handed parallel beta-helix repeat-containing protein [Actinospica durhamensis]
MVIAVAAGSASSVTSAAQATAAGATLYVNNTVSACSDSGTGTQAAPYCNVQAAFSAVQAGGTVIIVAGTYAIPATLSTSGTADAPITVSFGTPGATFSNGTSPSLSALTLANASYVNVDNAYVTGSGPSAISVTDSSHVTFAGGEVSGGATGLAISGASSDDSVTRLIFEGPTTAAVSIGPGATDTVIATDYVLQGGEGIVVDGASGTDVVGNELKACDANVSVSGGATDTTVENNLIDLGLDSFTFDCAAPTPLGLSVDADSAASTTEKYDSILAWTYTPIEWAGVDYDSSAAFQAATGQGAQEVVRVGASMPGAGPSDYVDDADALAPGETSTDFLGNSREDDPYQPNTGTGVGYYDRGAFESTDNFAAQIDQATPVSGTASTVSLAWNVDGGWAECPSNYNVTIDWGDGNSSTVSGKPCASASTAADTAATASKAGTTAKVSPADQGCEGECVSSTHAYAGPGTYGITFSASDGTVSVTRTASFTTLAADYRAYGPSRILDTRKGVGASKAKIQQGKYVKLKVAGVGGIPADVTAVALNLTVTDAVGNGYVSAEADGVGTPKVSNLNYLSGQTVANSAIVSVDTDGYIDIYNCGGSVTNTADLIADVTGYFVPAAASGYGPVALSRILDTRKGIGAPAAPVAGGGSVPVTVAGVDAIPASGVTAVAVHVTVTDTAGNGWVAAVPDGAGVPSTSTLNYLKGQTVSNTVIVPVGADGAIRLYNGGSSTPADLIVDVAGYFSASAPNYYVPLSTATRPVDTRKSGSTALQKDASSHFWLVSSSNLAAVVGNLTVTEPTANGFITAYPDGVTLPAVSNVNFLTGQTQASLAILDTNASEQAATNVYNGSTGTTELIIDVFGYFAS